jgi:hypothetical protein
LTNLEETTNDLQLKNINRWDPKCYINISLVKEVCISGDCKVSGYAFLPSAHGLEMDGVVQEARFFGSSKSNAVVTIHEIIGDTRCRITLKISHSFKEPRTYIHL